MNTRALALIAVLAALSGGCSLAPKYERPAPPVPDRWPAGPAYRAPAAPLSPSLARLLDWRSFFVDARLQKVIEQSLANNRDLRVAVLNIERTRALYRIQRAALFPQLDAGAAAGQQRVPASLSSTGNAATVEQYSVSGIASWELDVFGRLRSLKDRALEEFLATEQARRSIQIALMGQVADTYLLLAADQENLRLAQLTVEAQQASCDLIQVRQEKGIASELDLRQAQTRVEAARVDVARYTGQVAQDRNALDLLTGAPVEAAWLPQGLSAGDALTDITPDLPSEALVRRPDILQTEHQLKAMNANIGAARAAFFPRIALTSSLGTTSDDLSGLFRSQSTAWSYAAQASVPIFDAGANIANLDAAKSDRDIAVAQYEKAIQTAFREVADGLARQKTVNDQLNAQQSLVEASAQTFRLATARYERQVDSYLSVLDAQRSLYDAQQGLIAVRLSRLSNMVGLYIALGGGA